jgi:hypothetical protein
VFVQFKKKLDIYVIESDLIGLTHKEIQSFQFISKIKIKKKNASTSISDNKSTNKRSHNPIKNQVKKQKVSRFSNADTVDWEGNKSVPPDKSTSTSKFEYNKVGLKMILKNGMSNLDKGLGENKSGIVDYIDQGPMRAHRKGLGYSFQSGFEGSWSDDKTVVPASSTTAACTPQNQNQNQNQI